MEHQETKRPDIPQIHLTDLDYHSCLVRAPILLDIDDLLNVADTSKRMREAAQVALGLKYTRHFEIIVGNLGIRLDPGSLYDLKNNNCIKSRNTRFLLRFFRCFGQIISSCKLTLCSNGITAAEWQAIFEYVNRYSNISLKQLYIEHYEERCLHSATQPFVNVDDVLINFEIPKDQSKWLFTKVQAINVHSLDLGCLEQHLPELKLLKLDSFRDLFFTFDLEERKSRSLQSILECFRCNPQLRELHLEIPTDMIIVSLQSAAELLPSLEHLYIKITDSSYLVQASATMKPIHFKNVKTFVFEYYGSYVIPLTFDKLEHFECVPEGFFHRDYSQHEHVYDFIRNNPKIVKLTACNEVFKEASI